MENEVIGKELTTSLVQQYLYERKTWDRLLDYMQEENIHYKNRLSDILKNDIDRTLIDMIESFLNKFVLEDSNISILRHYISEANNKITAKQKDSEQRENIDKVVITQNKLRKEIEVTEKEFNGLKFEFNKYLSEHFETNG
jgi:hypothetical protein